MVLSEIDKNLLSRCLARKPNSWKDFVDRFLGLVVHVINQSAGARGLTLSVQDREDLAAEVFLSLLDDDFAVLRRFRGTASLSTYLTVVARRVVVRELLKRRPATVPLGPDASDDSSGAEGGELDRIDNRELVDHLLQGLQGAEADVIRLYHLEGKTYEEISRETGMAENSIGPTLSRARARLRAKGAPA